VPSDGVDLVIAIIAKELIGPNPATILSFPGRRAGVGSNAADDGVSAAAAIHGDGEGDAGKVHHVVSFAGLSRDSLEAVEGLAAAFMVTVAEFLTP